MMWSLHRRGWSPADTCPEYEKLKLVAEDLLAHVGETTSLKEFEQAQQGLLFYWQELQKRLDPLHPRFPGGHRCLDECYLEYAMKLRTRAVLQKPLPSPTQKPQPMSLETLLANVERVIADSAKETPFGHQREEERG
jgi:hypothetical protein